MTAPTRTAPRRKSAKAINYEEAREQAEVVSALRKQTPRLRCHFAVPNGHVRNRVDLAVKMEGVRKGAPDYLIFDAPRNVPYAVGVALEMKKTQGGTVRKEQHACLADLASCGWVVIIGHGSADAIAKLSLLGILTGFTIRPSLLRYPKRYERLKDLIERAAPLEDFLPTRANLNKKFDKEIEDEIEEDKDEYDA